MNFTQQFSLEPVRPPLSTARPEEVESAINEWNRDAMRILRPKEKTLDLHIVILSDNKGSRYGMILSSWIILMCWHVNIVKRPLCGFVTYVYDPCFSVLIIFGYIFTKEHFLSMPPLCRGSRMDLWDWSWISLSMLPRWKSI